MANTARGWPYPLGTDKVVDGDNQMKAITDFADANVGAMLIGSASGSGISEAIVDNFPTTLYGWFRITFQFAMSSAVNLNMQLRMDGVTNTGSVYGGSRVFLSATNASTAAYGLTTAWILNGVAGNLIIGTIDLLTNLPGSTPNVAAVAQTSTMGGAVGNSVCSFAGHAAITDISNGIRLWPASGTLNGTMKVYGMR